MIPFIFIMILFPITIFINIFIISIHLNPMMCFAHWTCADRPESWPILVIEPYNAFFLLLLAQWPVLHATSESAEADKSTRIIQKIHQISSATSAHVDPLYNGYIWIVNFIIFAQLVYEPRASWELELVELIAGAELHPTGCRSYPAKLHVFESKNMEQCE